MLGLCLGWLGACREPAPLASPIPTPLVRRLSKERSPYLRQHADNAVDWYPWGEEAFAKARAENKPVFLSVGYSTCHWCHVMEEESFLNPDVGRMLNERFVPIKVDRETRPDIDRLYMGFLLASTGSGGWPMSVFLTPNAQPFLAGTYYPQPAKYGRIGFLALLAEIAGEWERDPAALKRDAAGIAQKMADEARQSASASLPAQSLIETSIDQWREAYSTAQGGFGPAPKFPQPALLSFLLDHGCLYPESGSQKMALHTLEKMALGGINDLLDGGFHRYSTDERWRVPHFEKMLSDQAQLLSLYSRGYAITGRPIFARTARSIASYMERRLALPGGGLASAEDADSAVAEGSEKHAEGAFYLWDRGVLLTAAGSKDQAFATKLFSIESGENTLAVRDPKLLSDPRAERVMDKLRLRRDKRPRPGRDEKVLAGWNAMSVAALADAATALHQPEYLERARALMSFLESSMVVDGKLRRSLFDGAAEIDAFAQDYAEMVNANLSLYAACAESRYLARAVHWQERQDSLFVDKAGGGYFESGDGLLYRDKEMQDGALPSTASRSAQNLRRLYRLTGRKLYLKGFEGVLKSVGTSLATSPRSLPGTLNALDLMNGPEQSIVVVGDRPEWWKAVSEGYHPGRTAIWLKGPDSRTALLPPYLRGLPATEAVYFCQNFACGLPITSAAELRERLAR